MLINVTFVAQIAYFCIRPNKRREKQKSFGFLATFDFLEQPLSNFLRNFGQPFGKSRATCGKP